MTIDKISSMQSFIKSEVKSYKPENTELQKKPDSENKSLSKSAKYMIGATALAVTIAIGIIGHKNNWWRKAVQEGENLASHNSGTGFTEHTSPRNSINTGEQSRTSSGLSGDAVAHSENISPSSHSEPSLNLSLIKTADAATAEFDRIAAREIQELASNKSIIEEANAAILEFKGKNPADVLTAKNIRYEVERNTCTILNDEGKPIQRLVFNVTPEYLGSSWSKPRIIEYINPKTGKATKIIEQADENYWSIRMCNETGETLEKEIFINNFNEKEPLLIVKDYASKKVVPDKVTVFNTKENKVQTCIEYNTETGYPAVAYSKGHIYTPRGDNSTYFDSVIGSTDNLHISKNFNNFYGTGAQEGEDFIIPRYTKSGYIIEKGNSQPYSGQLTLLDPITREPKYTISVDTDSILLKEFDLKTGKPTALWIENGEIVSNKFDRPPKEVLEEMKEIFADLTPDLYPQSATRTPELIQEFIEKLAQ